MNWTNANWLLGLWSIPILAILLRRAAVVRAKRAQQFLDTTMRERLIPQIPPGRTFLRGMFLLVAVTFFFLAAAGPQFGVYFEKVSRQGADVMILLDTSRSMLAEDVAPNRLASAKLDIEDLLAEVTGDRVGLIAFAGKPILKVPLTSDFGFFRDVLKQVDTKTAPLGGTAIGDAVRLALRSMTPDAGRDQAIVLLSDGDDLESMPLEAAEDAAARNVRLFTVALGNMLEGARIPLFDRDGKRLGWEKYEGQEVWSKANGSLLADMAQRTGGAYLPAGTGVADLGTFYRTAMQSLERGEICETERRVLREKYQLFLFVGWVGFVASLLLPASRPVRYENSLDGGKNGSKRLFGILAMFIVLGFSQTSSAQNGTETSPPPEPVPPLLHAQNEPAPHPFPSASNPAEPIPQTPLDHYNVGVRAVEAFAPRAERRLAELSTSPTPDESPDENAPNRPVPDPMMPSRLGQEPEDRVATYRKNRLARLATEKELADEVKEIGEHFQIAAQNGSRHLATDAATNLDVLRSWTRRLAEESCRREATLRAEGFAPVDHLRWLEEEVIQTLESPPFSSRAGAETHEVFQKIHEVQDELGERIEDLGTLLQKTIFTEENGNLSDAEAAAMSQQKNESLQTSRDFLALAKKECEQFDPRRAKKNLRNALIGINAVRSTYLDYPTLLREAVAFAEPRGKQAAMLAENPPQLSDEMRRDASEGLDGSNRFVQRWTRQLRNDAEKEFAERPWSDDEWNAPEPETAPNNTSIDGASATPIDPQTRLRRSMKLALDLGPKIETIIDKIGQNLGDELYDTLVGDEQRIHEWLQEIQKPLEDPNQQQSDSQNPQNSDSNESSPNETPSEQNAEQSKNAPEDSHEEPEESAQQTQPKEGNPTEQQAEGLQRKVRQRQQQADEMRKLRDESIRRIDKPDKDW